MQAIARLAWWLGLACMVLAVSSRLLVEPIFSIESHAIILFAQCCLLVSIGASLLEHHC